MDNIFLRNFIVGAVALGSVTATAANANHLVLSEIAIYPSVQTSLESAEFVEIYNPTSSPIELDNYYFSDSNNYSSLPRSPDRMIDTNTTDQTVRFPAGYVIQPGQVVVITGGAQNLLNLFYGGDYQAYQTLTGGALLFEIGETHDDVPQMISLNSNETDVLNFSLTNPSNTNGEFAVLFYWDGISEVVRDVDIMTWGLISSGQNAFSPKSGFGYVTDNGSHLSMSIGNDGDVLIRTSIDEPNEVSSGGNGLAGHDESTETAGSWTFQNDRDLYMTPGVTDLTIDTENAAPLVTSVTRNIKYPAITDTVIMSATVTDPGDTFTVRFWADAGDGAGFVEYAPSSAGDVYSMSLPAVSEPALVKYYVTAEDDGGAVSIIPAGGESNPITFWHGEPFAGDTVLINEIQFDIIGTDNTEWIELYNRNSEEVSLAGYRIADATGEYLRFPDDAVIAGHGFVLVTYNEPNMREDYPGIPSGVPVYTYPFSQNNPGDTLTITSPNEYNFDGSVPTPIDIVEYSKTAPWPTVNPNVTGQSFELKSPDLDNNDGANWAPHPEVMVDGSLVNSGTPGEVNSMTSSVADWSVY